MRQRRLLTRRHLRIQLTRRVPTSSHQGHRGRRTRHSRSQPGTTRHLTRNNLNRRHTNRTLQSRTKHSRRRTNRHRRGRHIGRRTRSHRDTLILQTLSLNRHINIKHQTGTHLIKRRTTNRTRARKLLRNRTYGTTHRNLQLGHRRGRLHRYTKRHLNISSRGSSTTRGMGYHRSQRSFFHCDNGSLRTTRRSRHHGNHRRSTRHRPIRTGNIIRHVASKIKLCRITRRTRHRGSRCQRRHNRRLTSLTLRHNTSVMHQTTHSVTIRHNLMILHRRNLNMGNHRTRGHQRPNPRRHTQTTTSRHHNATHSITNTSLHHGNHHRHLGTTRTLNIHLFTTRHGATRRATRTLTGTTRLRTTRPRNGMRTHTSRRGRRRQIPRGVTRLLGGHDGYHRASPRGFCVRGPHHGTNSLFAVL